MARDVLALWPALVALLVRLARGLFVAGRGVGQLILVRVVPVRLRLVAPLLPLFMTFQGPHRVAEGVDPPHVVLQ